MCVCCLRAIAGLVFFLSDFKIYFLNHLTIVQYLFKCFLPQHIEYVRK